MRHLSDQALNGYADGSLGEAEMSRAERHVAECARCRGAAAGLRGLLARARALPLDVEPPPELWAAITASIASRKAPEIESRIPARRAVAGAPERRGRWHRWGGLAAAAVLLVALSSSITALLVRDGAHAAPRVSGAAVPERGGAALASFAATEAQYVAVAASLEETLAARRASLSPETAAAVERSVRAIDAAIAEARAALARDPANQALVEMLSASYEQKVDLLRRGAELPPRS
ncbi:MAG TPA: zf-HC2 domain-containing protein [Gemmatimonadaceae bacterium]|nr:zf-HC2 domain-containing protein [Gemmatimonadaceae bacterium]